MKYILTLALLTICFSVQAKDVLVYEQEDGEVSIVYPIASIDKVKDDFKDKDFIVMDSSELPQSKENRNSWILDGKKVKVGPIKQKKKTQKEIIEDLEKRIKKLEGN